MIPKASGFQSVTDGPDGLFPRFSTVAVTVAGTSCVGSGGLIVRPVIVRSIVAAATTNVVGAVLSAFDTSAITWVLSRVTVPPNVPANGNA